MLDSIKCIGYASKQAQERVNILNTIQIALLERQQAAIFSFTEFVKKYQAQIHNLERPISTDSALMDFTEMLPKGAFTQVISNIHSSVVAAVKEQLKTIEPIDIDLVVTRIGLWDLIGDDLVKLINEEYNKVQQ